jgi:hypothetical protein
MKNKILFLGSLCLILAIGLVFIGCETEVPVVDHPDFDEISIRVSRAGNGAAIQTPINNNFLVAWTAAEGVSQYAVIFRPVGKVRYESLGSGGQNADKYTLLADKSAFDREDNTDRDEYSQVLVPSDFDTPYPAANFTSGLTGQFGLLIYPIRADRNPVVVWDDVEYKIR